MPAVATGFWDQCCRPTYGELRRYLEKLKILRFAPVQTNLEKKAKHYNAFTPKRCRPATDGKSDR